MDPTVIRFKPGVRREGPFGVQYRTIHGYRRAFVPGRIGAGHPLDPRHRGQRATRWRPVHRAAGHRTTTVIAPDLLGHGIGEAPGRLLHRRPTPAGMLDLLSVLDIDRVTVVGHSLGGGVAAQFAYQFPERCERLVLVGSGGVGRTVSPLLRLAAVPGVEFLMPLFGLPPVQAVSRVAFAALKTLNTAIGSDTEEVLAVFDALPNTEARQAILRTLRSGVDWRGPGHHHAGPGLPGRGHADQGDLGPARRHHPAGARAAGPGRHAGQRSRDLRRGWALSAPHRPGALRHDINPATFIAETAPATFDAETWRERPACGQAVQRRARVRLGHRAHGPAAVPIAQRHPSRVGPLRPASVQDAAGCSGRRPSGGRWSRW